MKRLLLILLVAVTAFSFTGCAGNNQQDQEDSDNNKKTVVANDNQTDKETVAESDNQTDMESGDKEDESNDQGIDFEPAYAIPYINGDDFDLNGYIADVRAGKVEGPLNNGFFNPGLDLYSIVDGFREKESLIKKFNGQPIDEYLNDKIGVDNLIRPRVVFDKREAPVSMKEYIDAYLENIKGNSDTKFVELDLFRFVKATKEDKNTLVATGDPRIDDFTIYDFKDGILYRVSNYVMQLTSIADNEGRGLYDEIPQQVIDFIYEIVSSISAEDQRTFADGDIVIPEIKAILDGENPQKMSSSDILELVKKLDSKYMLQEVDLNMIGLDEFEMSFAIAFQCPQIYHSAIVEIKIDAIHNSDETGDYRVEIGVFGDEIRTLYGL